MQSTKPRRFQILSLSGGGYRGLHVAHALEIIEDKLGDQRIAQHFDLIAGTSIGGIIGLAIALEIPAKQIRLALEELGPKLFSKPIPNFQHAHGLFKESGLFDQAKYVYSNKASLESELKSVEESWYDPTPLRELLSSSKFFGNRILGDVLHPIIVPAVDYGRGLPKFFKTDHHNTFTFDCKLPIVDIALGTSAAPVYFPVHKINDYRIVDGGLVANDPTQVAVHEAMKFFRVRPTLYEDTSTGLDDLRILSIGTLSPKRMADLSKPLNQGLLDWGTGVFDLAASAQEAMSAFMIDSHMLPGKVFRLPSMDARPETAPGLADISAQATEQLKNSAQSFTQSAFGKIEFQDLFKHNGINLQDIRKINTLGEVNA